MNVTVTVRLLHDVVSRHPPPATRLSVVERTRSDDEQTRRVASATIIEAYWRPVYKYLRMKWSLGPDEAADLTQEFFTTTLEKDIVERDDSTRARFRTYLRLCPDGFASNARKAERRLKRGGGVTLVPLDFQTDGRSFYVMKLVGGRRLDEVLADRAPQALRLELFARVLEAVSFALGAVLAQACGRGSDHWTRGPTHVVDGNGLDGWCGGRGAARLLGDARQPLFLGDHHPRNTREPDRRFCHDEVRGPTTSRA